MNIPGFTAENSVYNTSGGYRAMADFGALGTADGLSMQAPLTAFAPSLGRIDPFPLIRCCGYVPMLHSVVCVTRRRSLLEQCRCTDSPSGYPIILCRPPVNALL